MGLRDDRAGPVWEGFALALAGFAAACGRTGLEAPELPTANATIRADPRASNLGTDFWAVSTVNSFLDARNRFNYAVSIGNANVAPAHVSISGGTLRTPLSFTVAPGQTVTRILPWVRELSQHSFRPEVSARNVCIGGSDESFDLYSESLIPDSTLVPGGAFHVHTDVPVSAYQFNPLEFVTDEPGCMRHSYTNDASLLLPFASFGTHFFVLTHRAAIRTAPGFFAVVGTNDGDTHVTVTPSVTTRPGPGVPPIVAHTPTAFTLHRGDVLELLNEITPDDTQRDLSGSEVSSDAPVAVFAGVDCTRVGGDHDAIVACDHVEEQLPPDALWGTHAVIAQMRDRGTDERFRTRIIARDTGTLVTFNPAGVHANVTLDRGETLTIDASRDFELDASAPVLVARFMFGQAATLHTTVGDPSMILTVPTSQYRLAYAFVVPATYTVNGINVVAPMGAHLWLDDAPMADSPERVGTGAFGVVHRMIEPGAHTLRTDAPEGAALDVFGAASYTSYAYPGGMNLERAQ